MANLTMLNDASVLHNLRQRYYSMLIYVSYISHALSLLRRHFLKIADLLGIVLRRHQSVQAIADLHRLGGADVPGKAQERNATSSVRCLR